MVLNVVFLLAVIVGSAWSVQETVDVQGVLRIDSGVNLTPGGSHWNFHSPNYPKSSPANLLQTWTIETHPDARIRIYCSEIRIPYQVPGTCLREYLLTVEDGNDIKEYCEAHWGLGFLSKTNKLKLTLRTGSEGMALVNCTAQGREMGSYGEVTEPPTTPRLPAYQKIESEEIDSSEHGVAPGKKETNCKCGWANKQNSRVVGGREALVNEYPHMVGLIPQNNPYFIFCGGSIITPFHVLTAAHCTHPHLKNNNPLAVRVGEHNIYDESETNLTQIINIIKIVEHEKYNDKLPLLFDVSLTVLEKRVDYTKFIGPICLPRGRLDLDNQNVKIAGWGKIAHYGPGSPVLKVVNVRVVPEEECFGKMTADSSRLCTYARNKSSCMGDSGGPVMWLDPDTNRYTIVGLVSYGSFCGGTLPMVSADVTSVVSWLFKKIYDTQPYGYVCAKV